MCYIRKSAILIMVFVILFLSSCEDTKTTKEDTLKNYTSVNTEFADRPVDYNIINGAYFIQYSDNYLYFYKLRSPLMRYNPETNNMTYVCGDPLCNHNSPDCPLYGLNTTFCVYNNKIFFRRDYRYLHRKADGAPDYYELYVGYCSYDLADSKLTVYEAVKNPTGDDRGYIGKVYELYAGKYRYYYDYIYNDKLEKYVYSICRMDLDTKEIVVFDSESNTSSNLRVAFIFCLGDRIYFSDLKSVYSTNYDLKDKKVVVEGTFPSEMYTDGSRIFWEDKNSDGSRSLYCMNLDGSNQAALNIKAWSWELTTNYIYYLTYDKITVGKLQSKSMSSSELNLTGSELHRCKHDGSDDETVWKAEGDYKYTRFNNWLVVGNYVYAIYTNWNDSDGDGIFTDADKYQSANDFKIMRINISDGNIGYIYKPD